MAYAKQFYLLIGVSLVTAYALFCQHVLLYYPVLNLKQSKTYEKEGIKGNNSCTGLAFGSTCIHITMPFFKCKMFVGILSSYGNFKRRQAIRNTWAKYPGNWTYVFLIGLPLLDKTQMENDTYGDLVLVHKKDTFFGKFSILPVKTATIYFIASIMQPEWILKTDDDSFVDIVNLFEILKSLKPQFYGGLIWHKASPVRSTKSISYVSVDQWKGVYPDYASGAGYLVSQDLTDCFLKKLGTAVSMPREDVFSGILAKECNVKPTHLAGFTDLNPKRTDILIRHKLKPIDIIKTWNQKTKNNSMLIETRRYDINSKIKKSEFGNL